VQVADIQEVEEKLRVSKESLETFRADFVKARDTFERLVRRLDEEGRILEDLLDKREESYRWIVIMIIN
jgi:septation ring formation regulator EzrA